MVQGCLLPLARDAPGATISVGEPPYPALLEKAKCPAEANVSIKRLRAAFLGFVVPVRVVDELPVQQLGLP